MPPCSLDLFLELQRDVETDVAAADDKDARAIGAEQE